MTAYGMWACSRRERVKGEFPAPLNNGNNSTKGDNPNRNPGPPSMGIEAVGLLLGKLLIAKKPQTQPRNRTGLNGD
jgi:hypothetical protein